MGEWIPVTRIMLHKDFFFVCPAFYHYYINQNNDYLIEDQKMFKVPEEKVPFVSKVSSMR